MLFVWVRKKVIAILNSHILLGRIDNECLLEKLGFPFPKIDYGRKEYSVILTRLQTKLEENSSVHKAQLL